MGVSAYGDGTMSATQTVMCARHIDGEAEV